MAIEKTFLNLFRNPTPFSFLTKLVIVFVDNERRI